MDRINQKFVYRGARTGQISFPLGGIGTGSIGLAGNGRLLDWEIFNRPSKGSVNGFSHFAIRAEAEGKVVDARILHGDLRPPYQGELGGPRFNSFGWGPRREYLTGLPHFADVAFAGEFPFAELDFLDDRFPGGVKLLAFNPFIPLDDLHSSIPGALFEFSVVNTTEQPLTYTLVGVLSNPLPANNLNQIEERPWGTLLHLTSDGVDPHATDYGDLTLAAQTDHLPGSEVSWQQYWYRGAWFDGLESYWHDLNTPGALRNRVYAPAKAGKANEGALAVHKTLAPGESANFRFVISWNFPNCFNYWKGYPSPQLVQKGEVPPVWRNFYATQWTDSRASAETLIDGWERLFAETRRFKDALFASSLPDAALDAVSANISILKSPTALRLEDGTFYGWEGCHPAEGCCEGSCTHVWNYAQALPFLFPRLERSMREADYGYNLREDGGMPFRLQLPIGSGYWNFRPCADGQFGGVLKSYRDWKICGDTEWLRGLWPAIKQSIEFAWSRRNFDRWDPEKTGVLWGRQHHTLDMELFGPNSWLTGFYLAALKAGAEMAEALGDDETAAEFREIFARGKSWVDANLFNGEYFIQRIDLTDRLIVEQFVDELPLVQGGDTLSAYWNEERGEIKYQIGEGSSIDQILAQWHADLYGLGDIFDRAQVKAASAAIFKYNFVPRMGEVYNPCRIYCLNDEGGLVICAWPEGATKPSIPAPYSQETMNGFEYSAAIHMIMNGLVDEGMTAVAAIRHRYDGERRNPWNEFECGSNYARSMASYALLNAFSGFEFDMTRGYLGFSPLVGEGHFRTFWSLESGWGEFESTPQHADLRLLYGDLILNRLRLPAGMIAISAAVEGRSADFTVEEGVLIFADPLHLRTGESLTIRSGDGDHA
jgi:uncharacterized protein (DUF608 family)